MVFTIILYQKQWMTTEIMTSYSSWTPKNTTSRLQILGAGIIRHLRVKYRKKLLKFVISRIDNNVKATNRHHSRSWCFASNLMDWICAGEGFRLNSDQLFSQVWFSKRASRCSSIWLRRRVCDFSKEHSSDVFPSDYIDFDMEVTTSQSLVDAENIAWRQESR